ncbi:glycosyltransferase family 9 protein [Parathalassolituus penaei]|uniref:Uncharacterized protein n=1 Tax=Parathalassolituus penaei TaxID=2997323 RepID=A0A9X3ITI9_9GAMM|nr:glycosyltransferase family 9 protein [Parathalassolituus penaei]MCY0966365.1 hypothetical protein [Parathalassolituus penaei]
MSACMAGTADLFSWHYMGLQALAITDCCSKREKQERGLLPWGNADEHAMAEHLVAAAHRGTVLPRMNLWDLSGVIAQASGAVDVDTGLMHVAASMVVPTVSIFGSTSVALTGAMGARVVNLHADYECSPCRLKICPKLQGGSPTCYGELGFSKVWSQLMNLLDQ